MVMEKSPLHIKILKEVMKDIGKMVKCMVKELFNGKINQDMMENMLTVLKKEKACSFILLEKFMKDNGKMESKMEREFCMIELELRRKKAFGRMELLKILFQMKNGKNLIKKNKKSTKNNKKLTTILKIKHKIKR